MGKRVFDLLAATAGLILLGPLLLLLALWIKLGSPGPVFYRGLRAGRGGKPFRIFKFRTMVVNAENLGPSSTADDDSRITPIGRRLRKWKLDELPQLFNVFLGDMSFVGPRPQVTWAVKRYSPEEQAALAQVRPGVTDLASLRFRDEGEILRGSADPDKEYFEKIHPEKMRLTLEYLHRRSFWLDCRILAQTIAVVVFRSGRSKLVANKEAGGSSISVSR